MKNKTKVSIIIGSILTIVITIFILWINDVFYIIDRQTSPNGKITTTVYSRNLKEFIPRNNGFTIKTSGDFKGKRISTDGSKFEQLWWSPDSNYQVVSTIYEGSRLLELKSYIHNSNSNLSLLINMSMSNYSEFTELMKDKKEWETLQFNFINWKEEQGAMTIGFIFTDYKGEQQNGKLDFNFETGGISNIEYI